MLGKTNSGRTVHTFYNGGFRQWITTTYYVIIADSPFGPVERRVLETKEIISVGKPAALKTHKRLLGKV